MKKDPNILLQHILDAVGDIKEYTRGMSREHFFEDRKTQDAVIRKMTIIGEVVKRLPSQMTDQEKDIPWKQIAGMRDLVVHDYADVDLQTVWNTIMKKLAPLKKAVYRLLKTLQ